MTRDERIDRISTVYSLPEQGGKDCGRNIQSYGEHPVLKSHGERARITNNDSWPFTHNIQYYLGHSARLFNKVTGRTECTDTNTADFVLLRR